MSFPTPSLTLLLTPLVKLHLAFITLHYIRPMQSVAQFHFLAHSGTSLIGAILLLAIYYNIRRRFSAQIGEEGSFLRVDKGLIYLSFALFTWVASGFWGYASSLCNVRPRIDIALQNLFSILNNIFFLLALIISTMHRNSFTAISVVDGFSQSSY